MEQYDVDTSGIERPQPPEENLSDFLRKLTDLENSITVHSKELERLERQVTKVRSDIAQIVRYLKSNEQT